MPAGAAEEQRRKQAERPRGPTIREAYDFCENGDIGARALLSLPAQVGIYNKEYRFVALRYEKASEPAEADQPEQYQFFETSQSKYRAFVTNMVEPIDFVSGFTTSAARGENLIKEVNNDAGLAAHPSGRLDGQSKSIPVGDGSLQSELLADAIQS